MNTPYSDPEDKTLTVATSPLLPDLFSDGHHLPSAREIILRLVHGWMIVRRKTLMALSHYGRRTLEEILPALMDVGLIKPLGRLRNGRLHGVGEELYTFGTVEPDPSVYSFKPRFRCDPEDPKALHQPGGLITSKGLVVPAHQYYVAESGAWMAEELTRLQSPHLVVPEQVLRGECGWHTDKTKRQKKTWFLTPVPDAWVFFSCYSLFLEVQLSEISTDRVRHVCENSPLGEPVLYVVAGDDADRLYQRFLPLLDEIPNFCLARFRNAEDLSRVWPRIQGLVQRGGFQPWWMRDHYAGSEFSRATMRAEVATLFSDNYKRATQQLKEAIARQNR